MISLTFDLTTGQAKLAQTTTIKQGAIVPVQIVFSAAPPAPSLIQLGLGKDTSDADRLLAYTETFAAENDTTWTGLLDASDAKLVTFMSGKGATTVLLELAVTLDGERQVAPNLSLAVQPPIIPADPGSDNAPGYYTKTEIDNLLLTYVPRTVAGKYRIKTDGTVELWNATQGKWQSVNASGAAGAEVLTFAIDNT